MKATDSALLRRLGASPEAVRPAAAAAAAAEPGDESPAAAALFVGAETPEFFTEWQLTPSPN